MKNIFAPFEKTESCFVELRGQSIVLVDGCCGLLVYGQDEIEISVLGGKRMCIFGEKLTLSYMSPEKIAVRGIVTGVRYV